MNANRKQELRSICARFEKDAEFLRRAFTMDDTEVHFYDPQTNQQSMEFRHSGFSRPWKCRVQKNVGKIVVSVFFRIAEVFS